MIQPPTTPWVSSKLNSGDLIDVWRLHHPNQRHYTRPASNLHPSSSRLDYTLLSPAALALLPNLHTSIERTTTLSDHFPITISFSCPPLQPSPTFINPRVSLKSLTTDHLHQIHTSLLPLTNYTLYLLSETLTLDQLISHSDLILSSILHHTRNTLNQRPHLKKPSALEKELQRAYTNWITAPSYLRTHYLHKYSDLLSKLETNNRDRKKKAIHRTLAQKAGYKRALQNYDTYQQDTNISFYGNLPPYQHTHPITSPTPPSLTSDPKTLCHIAAHTLEHMAGDPHFQASIPTLDSLLQHQPSIPQPKPLLPPTEDEFLAILSRGSATKTPGPDGVNSFLLRHAPQPLLHFLHKTLTKLWSTGLPTHWKHAHIRMLFKKGDPYLPSNYRPIALLNTIYKVATHHINTHMMSEATLHSLLSPHQHGFRPNHRTTDHIFSTYARATHYPNAYLTLYDFSKAFNSTPHNGLLHTLTHMNFHPTVTHAISNLYSNALDFPIVNGFTLSSYTVTRGVRQGCPLSPTLFALYMDPLLRQLALSLQPSPPLTNANLSPSSVGGFADDIGTFSPLLSDHQATSHILNTKGTAMGFSLSTGKQEMLAFGNAPHISYTSSQHRYSTYEDTVPREQVRYLGVYYHTSLSLQSLQDRLQLQIQDFYARLPSNIFSLREVILITNSQLIPALSYRLSGCCPPSPFLSHLQSIIWKNICRLSPARASTPHNTRYAPLAAGGLGLIFLPVHVASLYTKNLARYQLNEGPLEVNQAVMAALTHPPLASQPLSLSQSYTNAATILHLTLPRTLHNTRPIQTLLPPIPLSQPPPNPPFGTVLDPGPPTHIQLRRQIKFPSAIPQDTDGHTAYKLIQKHPDHHLVYTDGSKKSNTQAGCAAVLTDPSEPLGPHHVLAHRVSIPCSYFAELSAILLFLTSLPPTHSYIILSDNQSLVQLLSTWTTQTLLYPYSYAYQLLQIKRIWFQHKPRLKITWIPGHTGILGNEYADAFSSWACHLAFPPTPPSTLHSLYFHRTPLLGPPPRTAKLLIIPSHKHPQLDIPLSFLIWKIAGPFWDLPFHWQNGMLLLREFTHYTNDRLHLCPYCSLRHLPPHQADALSCLTHCTLFHEQRQQIHQTLPLPFNALASSWYSSASHTDQRFYIRGCLPLTLAQHFLQSPHFSTTSINHRRSQIKTAYISRAKAFLQLLKPLIETLNSHAPALIPTSQPGPHRWQSSRHPTHTPTPLPYKRPPAPTGIFQKRKKKPKTS